MQVKIDNAWKEITEAWCKIDGLWKTVENISANIGGVWNETWANAQPVPAGTIVAWAGTAEQIPLGWRLCDGTNGTPNLVNRFVKGGISPGATGGQISHSHGVGSKSGHTHSVSGGDHDHGRDDGRDLRGGTYSELVYKIEITGAHSHSMTANGQHDHGITTSTTSVLPPYFELAFIMKL